MRLSWNNMWEYEYLLPAKTFAKCWYQYTIQLFNYINLKTSDNLIFDKGWHGLIVLQVQWRRAPVSLLIFLLEVSWAVWWERAIFSPRGHVRSDWAARRGGHISGGHHTQDPVSPPLQLHWGHQRSCWTEDERGDQAGGKRWLEWKWLRLRQQLWWFRLWVQLQWLHQFLLLGIQPRPPRYISSTLGLSLPSQPSQASPEDQHKSSYW